MRKYGAVPTALWEKIAMQRLTDQAKLLAVYLLTGPHTNMLGCFRAPCGYLMEDLGWGREAVQNALTELVRVGFLSCDAQSGWVFIHDFIKWNPIQNPKQGLGVKRLFETIPEYVSLLKPLASTLLKEGHHLPEEFINQLMILTQEKDAEPIVLNNISAVDISIEENIHPADKQPQDYVYQNGSTKRPDILNLSITSVGQHQEQPFNGAFKSSIEPKQHQDVLPVTNGINFCATSLSQSLNSEKELNDDNEKNNSLNPDTTGEKAHTVSESIPSKQTQQQQEIITIFEHWKNTLQHPGAILDTKRKKLIQQALKMGYSVDQLCEAITGCSYTPHNMGENDRGQRYDGLHIILRDADQIDRFIHNCHTPPKVAHPIDKLLQANHMAAQNWLNQKMEESNLHEAN